MKIKRYIENETGCPTVKRYGRFPRGLGTLAFLSSALSVAIASGCSSTGGFKAQLIAPAVQSGQSMHSVDDGWYHPPESPGLGQG
jgi:hypothetical protein